MFSRRQRHQPTTTLQADGTADCWLCGRSMPVEPDGRCILGHRLLIAEAAPEPILASAPFAAPPAPVPPAAPEDDPYHHPLDDVLGEERSAVEDLLAWDDAPAPPSALDVAR